MISRHKVGQPLVEPVRRPRGRLATVGQAPAVNRSTRNRGYNAAFDTVVCTLALCSIPDPHAATGEMYRVLRPGGRLLLLDHVAATNPLLRPAQRLFENITSRLAADYRTLRPQPLLERAGFLIDLSQRFKSGTVERLRASKPAA